MGWGWMRAARGAPEAPDQESTDSGECWAGHSEWGTNERHCRPHGRRMQEQIERDDRQEAGRTDDANAQAQTTSETDIGGEANGG